MAYDYASQHQLVQVTSNLQTTRRAVPGWLAGVLAATGTLTALGFVTMAFFVSFPGLAIAGAIAIAVGSAAAAIVEPSRADRHAAVVAGYIVALVAAYMLLAQGLARLAPPGSHGGPGVDLPVQGAPATYPPAR
jgi:hypothetical protein